MDSVLANLSLHTIDQFHFLRPIWGLLLVPLVAVVTLQWFKENTHNRWQNVIAPHILEHLLVRNSERQWFNPLTLLCLLMVLFVIVLMGPAWSRQPSPYLQDDSALVVLLDVSESMLSEDIQPTRLERAKQKIIDLLTTREGGKTALIAFAGSAHTVLPLTSDHEIMALYMNAIEPDVMPVRGKFAENALPLIDVQVRNLNAPTTVLLVTDGLGSNTAETVTAYFQTSSHQLLILGIGASGPLTEVQSGVAPLEEARLEALAAATGGAYWSVSIDNDDISRLSARIGSFFVTADEEQVPWVDHGYYLIPVGALLFLMWFRKGWSINWLLLVTTLSSLPFAAPVYADDASTPGVWRSTFIGWWLTPDQQGRWYFSDGSYRNAAERFEDPLWKGVAYYLAEDFALAAEYFSRVDTDAGLFNLANAQAHQQNYLLAVRLYDEVLRRNPGYPAAEYNRRMLQTIIDNINRMSESQRDESDALGDDVQDGPRLADGVEEQGFEQLQEIEQLSAEQVLQDDSLNEMWMRSVQRDPGDFLANKFSQQAESPSE